MNAKEKAIMTRELERSRELVLLAMRPGTHPDVGCLAHAMLGLSYVLEAVLDAVVLSTEPKIAEPKG